MSKFTPGPWEAIIPNGPSLFNGTDIANFSIHSTTAYHDAGRVDNKTVVSGQYMDRIGHAESAANARLIAAAPEMYETLLSLTDAMTKLLDQGDKVDAPHFYQARIDARALLARING